MANILTVFRHRWMETTQGEVYMIDMELGDGTLLDYIQEVYSGSDKSPPGPIFIWNVMQQISAGLGEIHKRGIIHRDLKPANSSTLYSFSNLRSNPMLESRFRRYLETCRFWDHHCWNLKKSHCDQQSTRNAPLSGSGNHSLRTRSSFLHQQSGYLVPWSDLV